MPVPSRVTKADLEQKVKELEATIGAQDEEWNKLVDDFEKLEKDANTNAKLYANAKEELEKAHAQIEELKGNYNRNDEIASINERLIAEKKELIEEIEQYRNRNIKLQLDNSKEVRELDNLVLQPVKQDLELSIMQLARRVAKEGRAVHTDVGNRTFLTLEDAKKYAHLKHKDSIRDVLAGDYKSAGHIFVDGQKVRITDWREATEVEIHDRRLEILEALIYKAREPKQEN